MRSISVENQAALDAGNLVARDFVWFVVYNRDTRAEVTDGYWSDIGTYVAAVINPETGVPENRTWYGADGLIAISDIPAVSTLTVQNVTITLAQASDRINELVRTYDCKQGRVEVYRGLFDPLTREMVAPAESVFVGFIDEAPISTPRENDVGSVTLTCTSHTQEMTRSNSDTRSDASQKLRSATDNFYQDTAVVSSWQQSWGKRGSKINTVGGKGDKAGGSSGSGTKG